MPQIRPLPLCYPSLPSPSKWAGRQGFSHLDGFELRPSPSYTYRHPLLYSSVRHTLTSLKVSNNLKTAFSIQNGSVHKKCTVVSIRLIGVTTY